jgi:hypothetical protein
VYHKHGSVIGPVFFILNSANNSATISRVIYMLMTPIQIYGSSRPKKLIDVHITDCFNDVATWMLSNLLQLPADKTELMSFTTQPRRHQLPVVTICNPL